MELIDKQALREKLKDKICIFPAVIRRAIDEAPVVHADTLATSQEQRIKELTEENAEVKANWQKLKDSYDNNDKEWREAYTDVVKNMQAKLKSNGDIFNFDVPCGCSFKIIDQIAKEITEEIVEMTLDEMYRGIVKDEQR